MTVVLDWYLGDCGSVTSPAIDSLTPLISHSHLASHLRNKARMPLLPCPEPIPSPAARTGTSSLPWITVAYLMTRRWGLSFNWIETKKISPCSHFHSNVYRQLYFFVPLVLFLPELAPLFSLFFGKRCWRLAGGGAGKLKGTQPETKTETSPWLWGEMQPWVHTPHTRSSYCSSSIPTVASSWKEAHLGWPPPRGWGGKMHRSCSCFRMFTSAFILFFRGIA